MTSRNHTVLATLLVLFGLYVMRLATVEIQPYPEGLYALRGQRIQETMQWIDQAAISPGGMYSAMMPPLPAWMVAVGVDIVGPTPLAVRWFAVLCSMIIVLLTYLLARRVASFEGAIMAMVVVGTSIPMIVVGRQADAVIPWTAAALAVVWSMATLGASESSRRRVVASGVLVLATAAGLLSAPVAMMFLVLAAAVLVRIQHKPVWMYLAVGLGCILGLSWWGVMASRYGEQVLLAWSLPTPTRAVESGGVLSPIGMLITSSPLLVLALVWVVVALRDRATLLTRQKPEVLLAGAWFLVSMLVLAVSQQRGEAQILTAIPPAAIVAMVTLEYVRRQTGSRLLFVCFFAIVAAAGWFLVDHLVSSRLNLQTLLLGVAICLVAVVSLLTRMRSASQRQTAAVRLYQPIVYGAIAIAGILALVRVVQPGPSTITGGRQIARLMLDDSLFHRSFAYVYHNTSETDVVNAQLEWYTQGWMSGTKPGFTHLSVALPAEDSDEATLGVARLLPWVVYYHPRDRSTLQEQVGQSMRRTHAVAFSSDHYTLYKLR